MQDLPLALVGVFDDGNAALTLVTDFADFFLLCKMEEHSQESRDDMDRYTILCHISISQYKTPRDRLLRVLDVSFRLFEAYSASSLNFRKFHHLKYAKATILEHGALAISDTGVDETAHKLLPKVIFISKYQSYGIAMSNILCISWPFARATR